MSNESEIRQLLADLPVPIPVPTKILRLDGGLSNRVYRILGDDHDLVLRLGPKPVELPDIDCELAIVGRAATADIGPELIFADVDRGILLTRFIPGNSWRREDLLVSGNLEMLAQLLREVHALPRCGVELEITAIAETHFRALHRFEGLRQFGATCLEIVNGRDRTERAACCHNDIVAENIIAGDRLRLIDWEWAADNEPLFDLASVVAYHDLDPDCAAALLDAHTGGIDGAVRERFAAQLRLFDALQWLWLAAKEAGRPDSARADRLRVLRSRIAA